MASRTRRFLISRPGAESYSSTIRWRAAAKSESTAGCESATDRRTVWRRHNGKIVPRIGSKIRLFSRSAHRFVENRERLSNLATTRYIPDAGLHPSTRSEPIFDEPQVLASDHFRSTAAVDRPRSHRNPAR